MTDAGPASVRRRAVGKNRIFSVLVLNLQESFSVVLYGCASGPMRRAIAWAK
ncbi:MAG: hypothetical protein PWQ57_1004 [Desulfovibrionales bacterium]|nr:hypothetical protein [Desulfovibrionales bacterium]